MARTKHHSDRKRQLGQFLTPPLIAENMLATHRFSATDRVLEPGFGSGAFLLPLIERFMALRNGDLAVVLNENVWGIELDEALYEQTLAAIRARWGDLPAQHNLVHGDFLLAEYPGHFDFIIGNPPFGGTVNVDNQLMLERRYGRRGGFKIKRETYALFIVKSLDLLSTNPARPGTLSFICSNTFLTIPTMKGLRKALMDEGACEVIRLSEFSGETAWPMVVLNLRKGVATHSICVEHREIPRAEIDKTKNLSWRAGGEFAPLLAGPVLADYLTGSSGMTTGRNEWFVREIVDGAISEPYAFSYVDEPVTLEREIARARLGKLSEKIQARIRAQEARGDVRRNVKVSERAQPLAIPLPHPDYRYYNKAQRGMVYLPPQNAIYWKDDGDAVLTFKRNGNWYLQGVGGAAHFLREGLTWRLVCSRLEMRWLPAGYILDTGSPCAFLKDGIAHDELWFILGWTLTETATAILKSVLNHTRNIQSKDVEQLPYPWWVSAEDKQRAITRVKTLVERAQAGETFVRSSADIRALADIYRYAG